jgi:UDP-N-acetylglucosamine acyltransferase
MTTIHSSAMIDKDVELAEGVEIGPRCTISGAVRLGEGVRLIGDVYLIGPLTIGSGTTIYPYTCIGFPPQDVKFKLGDKSPGVVIGRDCVLRERVSIHAASHETQPTTLGDRGFLMVNAHLGHDSQVGSDVTLVNNVSFGGHSIVADRVIVSGHTGLHQFVQVGYLAFIASLLPVTCDVPPFAMIGRKNEVMGVNVVGMRRAGYSNETITQMRRVFRKVFRVNIPRKEMLDILDEIGVECEPAAQVATFIRGATRPICHGKQAKTAAVPT